MKSKNNARKHVGEWKSLFSDTQALPQAQEITDKVITTEIDAYRAEEKAKNMPKITNRLFTTQSSLDSFV